MTASIHPIPTRANALSLARAVTSRPDMHSNRVLLDACDMLDEYGDWMDAQVAMQLRRTIPVEDVIHVRGYEDDADSMAPGWWILPGAAMSLLLLAAISWWLL